MYFSRVKAPQIESGLLFRKEDVLRDFFVDNHRYIPGLDHLLKPRPEFPLDSRRRIDILFTERHTGALVVTELKLGVPPDGVVAQLFDYMYQLSRMPIAEGRAVKGLLVTGQPAAHLVQLVLETAKNRKIEVTWCYYRTLCGLHRLAGWPEQDELVR